MIKCQNCNITLENLKTTYGKILICPKCFGHYYSENSIKNLLKIDFWMKVKNKSKIRKSRLICGNCNSKMKLHILPKIFNSIEIDICNNCELIWLDKNEIESLNINNSEFNIEKKAKTNAEIEFLLTINRIQHKHQNIKNDEILHSLYNTNSEKSSGLLHFLMTHPKNVSNLPKEIVNFIKKHFQ
ncbi:hypothetical protein EHQ47_16795 [Leptospira bourretii]|nr:hypothetical protein EHQ47_16795 [Leptospira bourretii]